MKRVLRDLSMKAHEEELRRGLLPLAQAFDDWRDGKISSGELTEIIHEFHQGSARDLFVRYNRGVLTANVAHAVASGILSRSDVPEEALEYLEGLITFYGEEAGGTAKKA